MTEHTGKDAGPTLDPAALERIRRVGGDALLGRMIAAFLEHTPARVDTARTALEPPVVLRAAHALRSSAGNLGLTELSRIAEAIEQRASAGDTSYDALRPALADAYAAARAELERQLGAIDT